MKRTGETEPLLDDQEAPSTAQSGLRNRRLPAPVEPLADQVAVKAFLDSGAVDNDTQCEMLCHILANNRRRTALHFFDDPDFVPLFDDRDRDPHRKDPLYYALASPHLYPIAIKIIDRIVEKERTRELNRQDDEGCTALHYSAMSDSPITERLLAVPEVDPTILEGEGRTALHLATSSRHVRQVSWLCERDPKVTERVVNLQDKKYRCTPLLLALWPIEGLEQEAALYDTVEVLMRNGARLDIAGRKSKDDPLTLTPLGYAVESGSAPLVALMLKDYELGAEERKDLLKRAGSKNKEMRVVLRTGKLPDPVSGGWLAYQAQSLWNLVPNIRKHFVLTEMMRPMVDTARAITSAVATVYSAKSTMETDADAAKETAKVATAMTITTGLLTVLSGVIDNWQKNADNKQAEARKAKAWRPERKRPDHRADTIHATEGALAVSIVSTGFMLSPSSALQLIGKMMVPLQVLGAVYNSITLRIRNRELAAERAALDERIREGTALWREVQKGKEDGPEKEKEEGEGRGAKLKINSNTATPLTAATTPPTGVEAGAGVALTVRRESQVGRIEAQRRSPSPVADRRSNTP